jgi:hypothetical protein
LPCTRIHGHPPSTLLHPQQLPKRRLGTIPGPANPSSSPYACCSHCPFAKHHALAPCCRPNLVGILLFTPSWGIHHHWDSTTSIHLGRPPIDPLTASPDSLLSATFVILIFVDQKNAVRGKTVGHGHSGDPQACPVLAIVCRILHLHSFNAPPHMPLCALNATSIKVAWHSPSVTTSPSQFSTKRANGPLAPLHFWHKVPTSKPSNYWVAGNPMLQCSTYTSNPACLH